jgi:1,4-alpha-glucan branching enzyme
MNLRHALPLCLVGLTLAGPARAQSAREGIGATPYADAGGTGVTFRTWAPNASTVVVKGGFNGWGSTALTKESSGGLWSVDVPNARAGQEYKFVVNGTYKKDPRGRRVVNSAGNSIVYNPAAFSWGDSTNFSRPWRNDLVIYQMHVGSYNAESWLPSTFDQCIEKIPYIKSLGVSAVKLMPVNEFPGDRSWGYNPSDPYAIEASFGGPDGLKRFVKACHENGLAVLIDVVHNHYGPSDLEMWQYDGWSTGGYGGIYFYNDWRANTDWGSTRPDYGREEVRDYVKGQIRMFLEEYKVDGFRWDSVYNIRNASGTWNPDGSDMLWDINTMVRDEFNDAYRIAEDHAFDTDVRFESQWDHGFLNDIRGLATTPSDSDRNMNVLAWHLANGGDYRVVYAESHDSCGDLNDKHRLPYDVDSGSPDGYWAKKRSLLAHTIALVSPGIPMIFAGSEMHEWYTFSNNQALRWSLTNENAGIVRAFADLIHLRRNLTGISAGLKQHGNVDVHHVDDAAKVVGAIRWDQGGGIDDLVIAINCSATARTGYSLAFPSAGTWYCLYNSDSAAYDPLFGNVGPAVGGTVTAGATAALDLGAYSLQIYSKSRPPESAAVSFDPPAPDGCGTVVTISYEAHDGPLQNPTNVWAYIGRNGWLDAADHPMTPAGDGWTLAYEVPQDTYELNLSFSDGGTRWDNNGGTDWRLPITGCGDLPAAVSLNPAAPQGCIPVKFTYEINAGPLTNGAPPVYLFIGRNGWQNAQHVALTNEIGDTWSGWYAIPDDTWELNYVFHNASDVWDNNGYEDWSAIVASCVNSEQPHVAIVHPAAATNVANAVNQLALQGTASLLAGHLRWTNQLNGASGAIAYATNWSIASVPLAAGVNVVRVSGTNSTVNPNDGAGDSPTSAVYSASQSWIDGQNGGTNLKPWRLNGGATALLAVSNDFCSFATHSAAWALQATNGGFIEAIRPFAASLQPGDQVSFVFENGGVDGSPSSVGVAFHNRFDQRLAEIYFEGGGTNYVVNDVAPRPTGIPWGNGARNCTFELLDPLSYRLTVGGQAFEGTFPDASEYGIAHIRFWNYNAGDADERMFFIGPISVTGAPRPVLTYSAETAVTRAASTNPVCRTEAIALTPAGFVATVSSLDGLADNVWQADTLIGGGWNWTRLPADEYELVYSNNTVVVMPVMTNYLKVISVGAPGGSD